MQFIKLKVSSVLVLFRMYLVIAFVYFSILSFQNFISLYMFFSFISFHIRFDISKKIYVYFKQLGRYFLQCTQKQTFPPLKTKNRKKTFTLCFPKKLYNPQSVILIYCGCVLHPHSTLLYTNNTKLMETP